MEEVFLFPVSSKIQAVLLTFGLAGTTQGMPQQESGQVWTTASTGSNCKLLYEEIHSQKCKPKQVEKCVTVNFQTDDVDYKRVCKDVTSVHCPTTKSAQYGKVPLKPHEKV